MQYKILVVEDEEFIRDGLHECLEMEDYEIAVAGDGDEALLKADEFLPHLVILDVMMPKKNGFDVCRILRKKYPNLVIIMLTAKGEETSKVTGLNIGADDYITKPFSTLELLARVNAFFRKLAMQIAPPALNGDESAEFRGIKLDFKKYEAIKNGAPLDLNAREFQLLNMFWKRRSEVISREELIQLIDSSSNSRTIDNYIVKLRQKIEDDPENPRLILSIRGMGYKLDV
ncbi:MAG: response regulator transcription factor [Candidatus Fibromonas sp.]|jgi:DNA-binding response OmpR family regulator|nr:response regulator transcription factor [Candidatus Fibromonas sp.]